LFDNATPKAAPNAPWPLRIDRIGWRFVALAARAPKKEKRVLRAHHAAACAPSPTRSRPNLLAYIYTRHRQVACPSSPNLYGFGHKERQGEKVRECRLLILTGAFTVNLVIYLLLFYLKKKGKEIEYYLKHFDHKGPHKSPENMPS
jgi:hypothetical protein